MVECEICKKEIPDHLVFVCYECGNDICNNCFAYIRYGEPICKECIKE